MNAEHRLFLSILKFSFDASEKKNMQRGGSLGTRHMITFNFSKKTVYFLFEYYDFLINFPL